MVEKINRYDHCMDQKISEKKSREKNLRMRKKETPSWITASWADFEVKEMENTKQGIVSGVRNNTLTLMQNNSVWNATLNENIPSKLIRQLVVGDTVFFKESLQETSALIEARKPRSSVLTRFKNDKRAISGDVREEQVIAANVDIAVIVVAKCRPDFHPRFADRYVVICENNNITPLICINKSDLSENILEAIQWYRSAGILVIETSVTTGVGIDILKQHLRGKMVVFVGNSGVGKSSLINAMISTSIETQEVSAKTGKGKHTTTASSLYNWDKDSYLIDTPGIRSLGVFHIDKSNLQMGFPEFTQHISDCHYTDCTHSHEPICGVKKAVTSGSVNRYRYESYLRMLEE
jgi:ribosome biogenesis GTPase